MGDVCRICQAAYASGVKEDIAAHKAAHVRLANGGMPLEVREFLKGFGWAVAHNDGGVDRLKGKYGPEIGKLAVVYSWWARARSNGCATTDFDKFMNAHLAFADAMVGGDSDAVRTAAAGIKTWEQFAG